MNTFGQHLSQCMVAHNLTTESVAVSVGVSSKVIQAIESGVCLPTPKLLDDFYKLLPDLLPSDCKLFGGVVRYFRLAQGLSIDQLAEQTGLEAALVRALEQADVLPGQHSFACLALALGVDFTAEALSVFGEEFTINQRAILKDHLDPSKCQTMGELVQFFRKQFGYTVAELAEVCELSSSLLFKVERDFKTIKKDKTVHHLGRVFGERFVDRFKELQKSTTQE